MWKDVYVNKVMCTQKDIIFVIIYQPMKDHSSVWDEDRTTYWPEE